MSIPERVFCVKAVLVVFWAYTKRNRLTGVFSEVLQRLGPVRLQHRLGCRGRFFEVCGSLLFITAAPQSIPSWMRLPCGSRSGRRVRLDTEYSVATVPPTRGRLNQTNARQLRSSPLDISDWPRVARASSSRRRRADTTVLPVGFQGFPGSPFRLRRRARAEVLPAQLSIVTVACILQTCSGPPVV